jgi:hypothetical protein
VFSNRKRIQGNFDVSPFCCIMSLRSKEDYTNCFTSVKLSKA